MKRFAQYLILVLVTGVVVSCVTGPQDGYELPISGVSNDIGDNSLLGQRQLVNVHKVLPARPMIRGICFISQEPGHFFELPCQGIQLSLSSDDSEQPHQAQTDERGRFYFQVKKSKPYTLDIESEKYRMASSETKVSAGAEVLIRLIKK